MSHLHPTRSERELLESDWNESLDYLQLGFTLKNDASLIVPLVNFLCNRASSFGLCQGTLEQHLGVALEEALLNALYHGNLELSFAELQQASEDLLSRGEAPTIRQRLRQAPYSQRRIHVQATVSSDQALFVIRDEGPGFDYAACTPLVIDDGELARPQGRGLLLMFSFMDEVRFNAAGNEVTMILRCNSDCPDTELEFE